MSWQSLGLVHRHWFDQKFLEAEEGNPPTDATIHRFVVNQARGLSPVLIYGFEDAPATQIPGTTATPISPLGAMFQEITRQMDGPAFQPILKRLGGRGFGLKLGASGLMEVEVYDDVPIEGIPPPSPDPHPCRVEVGPEGGPFQGVWQPLNTGTSIGNVRAFLLRLPPPPGTVEGLGRVFEVDDTPRSAQATDQPGAAQSSDVRWEIRLVNVSGRRISSFVKLNHTQVTAEYVTRIPTRRFETVFRGVLEAITPRLSLTASNRTLKVEFPHEFASEVGLLPHAVDLPSTVEARNLDVDFAPATVDLINARTMFLDGFRRLGARLAEVPDRFAEDLMERLEGGAAGLSTNLVEAVRTSPSVYIDVAIGNNVQRVRADDARKEQATDVIARAFGLAGVPTSTWGHGRRSGRFWLVQGPPRDLKSTPAVRVMLGVDQVKVDFAISTILGSIEGAALLKGLSVRCEVMLRPWWSSADPLPVKSIRGILDEEPGCGIATRYGLELKVEAVEVEFDSSILDGLESVVDYFVSYEDALRDALRDAVAGLIDDKLETVTSGVLSALRHIAERDMVLATVGVTDHHVLLFSRHPPDQVRKRVLPLLGRQLLEPIDGPMPSDAAERLESSIDHIVVVMMENRSFDHALGYLSLPGGRPGGQVVDGLTQSMVMHVSGGNPNIIRPRPTSLRETVPDPYHGHIEVMAQINEGLMDGFYESYKRRYLRDIDKRVFRTPDPARIAEYIPRERVGTFDYLAREFTVLDRWFTSFPGGTYPNRMCALAGYTSEKFNTGFMDKIGYTSGPTVFEMLDRAGIDWRLFESDVSFARMFRSHRTDFARFRALDELRSVEVDYELPPVTFIEPAVTGYPGLTPPNDDHPPTDIANGQLFLDDVIRMLKRLRRSWPRTLVIVTYDEHGGFFDHVPPPGTDAFHALYPGVRRDNLQRVHPDVTLYGPRVPAFAVGPFIARGATGSKIYDHCTIIRTILQRFAPAELSLAPGRIRQARHLGELLTDRPREAIPDPGAAPARAVMRAMRDTNEYARSREPVDPHDAHQLIRRLGLDRRKAAADENKWSDP